MVFLLFRKQNKEVLRVCIFYILQRENFKAKRNQVFTETEKNEEFQVKLEKHLSSIGYLVMQTRKQQSVFTELCT